MDDVIRNAGFTRLQFAGIAFGVVALMLSGCGGGTGSPSAANSNAAAPSGSVAPIFNQHSQADESGLEVIAREPGATPYIAVLSVFGNDLPSVSNVGYTVQPKAGSVSKAVHVSYSYSALTARGYLKPGDNVMTLPVIGLYAGYTNSVALQFQFQDGSTATVNTNITTAEYTDQFGIYVRPTILKQRSSGSTLGFDFFYIKSELGYPVIVDTDGEVRWILSGTADAFSTALQDDEFIIGSPSSPVIQHVRLDGTITQSTLAATNVTNFHHNIDFGNTGLLVDVATQVAGIENVASTVIEMTPQGSVLHVWDLAAIISAYMLSQGDDPTAFVRPAADWFHNNAAAYDSSDNTVIISSRENFVIKLDYSTGRIIWILGDPTKYWYTFPSLRAKALTLAPGGLYPIGQHAVSVISNDHLLVFNDGLGSVNQPAGAPAGETRAYSAVSAYSIDENTMTAQNIWNFKNGETVFSSICSSAYKAPNDSLLIDYATADNMTIARLEGLDSNHNVVFDFEYQTQACNTSWNAVPIPLENFPIT